jgi:hypothetical protein
LLKRQFAAVASRLVVLQAGRNIEEVDRAGASGDEDQGGGGNDEGRQGAAAAARRRHVARGREIRKFLPHPNNDKK